MSAGGRGFSRVLVPSSWRSRVRRAGWILFSLLIKSMGKSSAKNVKWLPQGHTISLPSHQEDKLSALPGPLGLG